MVNIWTFLAHAAGAACPLCAAPADGICGHCMDTLPFNRHACPRCALPLPPGAPPHSLCGDCQRKPPPFDCAFAALRYEAPVDDLIGGFKYHRRLALGAALGDLLAAFVDGARVGAEPPGLLIPVPASPARLRERGFNQAAELARHLSRHLGIPWSAGLLVRRGTALPQRGLGREQRRRNTLGTLALEAAAPRCVALVDDVMTTGATAAEASRMLRGGGAGRVEVWTVARTPAGPRAAG